MKVQTEKGFESNYTSLNARVNSLEDGFIPLFP
jgi:exonuclease VII small subunit